VAEELKRNLGAEVGLIEGGHGVFEVRVDGKLIFSRAETGRFPRPGEISELVRRSQAAPK
jgi:selT/selW/selH-like putative selenoprotein